MSTPEQSFPFPPDRPDPAENGHLRERLRPLLEMCKWPALLLSEDLRILQMNKSAETMFRYSSEECENAPCGILFTEVDWEEFSASLKSAISKGEQWEEDIYCHTKAGEMFQAHAHISTLYPDDSGKAKRLALCMIKPKSAAQKKPELAPEPEEPIEPPEIDLSLPEDAEDDIEERIEQTVSASPHSQRQNWNKAESDRLFREIVEALDDIHYRRTLDGEIYIVNPAVERVLGYEPREALAPLQNLLSDHAMNDEFLEQLDAGSEAAICIEPRVCEFTHKKPDVHLLLQLHEQAVRDPDGSIVAVQGVAHDPGNLVETTSGGLYGLNYRKMFQAIQEAIWVEDQSGRLLDANQYLFDRLGYTRANVDHLTREDIISPDRMELFDLQIKQLGQQKEARFNSELLTRRAERIPCEIIVTQMPLGEETALLVQARDISRSQQELRLLQDQNRDMAILNGVMRQLLVRTDLPSLLQNILNELLRSFELQAGAIYLRGEVAWLMAASAGLPKSYRSAYESLDFEAEWVLALAEQKVLIHREHIGDREGKISPELKEAAIQSTLTMRFGKCNGAGEAIVMLGSAELEAFEQGEIRLLEQLCDEIGPVLEQSCDVPHTDEAAERFVALFDNMALGMLTFDRDGVIQLWNPGCEVLHGLTAKEIEGKSLYRIFAAQFPRIDFGQVVRDVFDGKEIEKIEHDEQRRTLGFWFYPVRDAEREIVAGVCVQSDISEARELERNVFESETLATLQDLAAGLGNDFNNLLNAIMGYASLMQENLPIEHAHHNYLKLIQQSCQRGSDITRQLLGYSTDSHLMQEDLDLNQIIRSCEERIKHLLPRNVRLATRLAPNIGCFEGNRQQIEQSLLNLCLNGGEALRQGGTVTVETFMKDVSGNGSSSLASLEPGRYAVLSVSDTGEGIERENLEKIFRPYFSTRPGHRGLGLTAVRAIVDRHYGHIELRSVPNSGSRFDLYFPVEWRVDISALTPEERPLHAEKPVTILVIDDNRIVRQVTRQMIESMGHECIQAANGLEGVRCYARYEKQIDLVLLDIMMPIMSGRETYDCLRAINPNARVIFSSGFDIHHILRRMETGPDALYIQKPFHFAAFREVIEDALGTGAEQ